MNNVIKLSPEIALRLLPVGMRKAASAGLQADVDAAKRRAKACRQARVSRKVELADIHSTVHIEDFYCDSRALGEIMSRTTISGIRRG